MTLCGRSAVQKMQHKSSLDMWRQHLLPKLHSLDQIITPCPWIMLPHVDAWSLDAWSMSEPSFCRYAARGSRGRPEGIPGDLLTEVLEGCRQSYVDLT